MVNEIDYIKRVCDLERKHFKGTSLDVPFIGINSMLPSLINKMELLAQTVLEYDKILSVYGRKQFVGDGILECNDGMELQSVCDALDVACEVMDINNEEYN